MLLLVSLEMRELSLGLICNKCQFSSMIFEMFGSGNFSEGFNFCFEVNKVSFVKIVCS